MTRRTVTRRAAAIALAGALAASIAACSSSNKNNSNPKTSVRTRDVPVNAHQSFAIPARDSRSQTDLTPMSIGSCASETDSGPTGVEKSVTWSVPLTAPSGEAPPNAVTGTANLTQNVGGRGSFCLSNFTVSPAADVEVTLLEAAAAATTGPVEFYIPRRELAQGTSFVSPDLDGKQMKQLLGGVMVFLPGTPSILAQGFATFLNH